ncbi:MAG: hypothetical protein AAGJ79_12180 [Verrucomicrobiota bacterium]
MKMLLMYFFRALYGEIHLHDASNPLQIKTMPSTTTLLAALLGAALFASLTACSTTTKEGETYFSDIKYYHLKPGEQRIPSQDPSVRFQEKHLLYGAISQEERDARAGHYYVFLWKTKDTASPAEVVFEFRQQLSGSDVQTVSVNVPDPRKKNTTKIAVTGDIYVTNGPVTSWRVSIQQNGQEVASEKSYLWD